MRKVKQVWMLAGALLVVSLMSYYLGYTQGATRPEVRPDAPRQPASGEPGDGVGGKDGHAGGSMPGQAVAGRADSDSGEDASGTPADGKPVVVPSGVPAHQRENAVRTVRKLRACLAEADAAYEREDRKQALDAYQLALFIEEAYPYRMKPLLEANDLDLTRAHERVVELRESLR